MSEHVWFAFIEEGADMRVLYIPAQDKREAYEKVLEYIRHNNWAPLSIQLTPLEEFSQHQGVYGIVGYDLY